MTERTADDEALDALPDGVLVAGADGAVERMNRLAEIQLGLAEGAGIGRPLSEVVALQDEQGRDWAGCVRPYDGLNSRIALSEQSWLLPSGAEVLVTGRLRPSRPGGPVERVGLVLRSARGRERVDRERSDLVAAVAHELRSPLTGVRGFVGALLNRWDDLSDPQRRLMLETADHDAARLGRLITELLDVARIDTGRLSLYRYCVDLVPAAEQVLETIRVGTNRALELHAPATVTAYVDPDKLAQMLTNLLDNAVRHGEGTVRVSLTQGEAGEAIIHVDDQGAGIAPDIRRRVVTKFWTRGDRQGSGLGLYLVNGLAGLHGGRLEIGDAPGGGARLSVVLPEPPKIPDHRTPRTGPGNTGRQDVVAGLTAHPGAVGGRRRRSADGIRVAGASGHFLD